MIDVGRALAAVQAGGAVHHPHVQQHELQIAELHRHRVDVLAAELRGAEARAGLVGGVVLRFARREVARIEEAEPALCGTVATLVVAPRDRPRCHAQQRARGLEEVLLPGAPAVVDGIVDLRGDELRLDLRRVVALRAAVGGIRRATEADLDTFGKAFAVVQVAVVQDQIRLEARGESCDLRPWPGGLAGAVLQWVASRYHAFGGLHEGGRTLEAATGVADHDDSLQVARARRNLQRRPRDRRGGGARRHRGLAGQHVEVDRDRGAVAGPGRCHALDRRCPHGHGLGDAVQHDRRTVRSALRIRRHDRAGPDRPGGIKRCVRRLERDDRACGAVVDLGGVVGQRAAGIETGELELAERRAGCGDLRPRVLHRALLRRRGHGGEGRVHLATAIARVRDDVLDQGGGSIRLGDQQAAYRVVALAIEVGAEFRGRHADPFRHRLARVIGGKTGFDVRGECGRQCAHHHRSAVEQFRVHAEHDRTIDRRRGRTDHPDRVGTDLGNVARRRAGYGQCPLALRAAARRRLVGTATTVAIRIDAHERIAVVGADDLTADGLDRCAAGAGSECGGDRGEKDSTRLHGGRGQRRAGRARP